MSKNCQKFQCSVNPKEKALNPSDLVPFCLFDKRKTRGGTLVFILFWEGKIYDVKFISLDTFIICQECEFNVNFCDISQLFLIFYIFDVFKVEALHTGSIITNDMSLTINLIFIGNQTI